jgi:hypothetical protein
VGIHLLFNISLLLESGLDQDLPARAIDALENSLTPKELRITCFPVLRHWNRGCAMIVSSMDDGVSKIEI